MFNQPDFQPKYVYCGRCCTSFAIGIVGALCPTCGVPFSNVIGTTEPHLIIPDGLRSANIPRLASSTKAVMEEANGKKLSV